eukprot:6184238-Pleurochrysis_carterae.AAC.1
MNTERIQASTLVTAAVLATAVRLFLYILGSNDGRFLQRSIYKMGLSVIILEMCIVILRFFTVFKLMRLTYTAVSPRRVPPVLLLVSYGVILSFLLTFVSKGVSAVGRVAIENGAVVYLQNRPFEPLPVFVEYASIYLLHNNIVNKYTGYSVLCVALIALVIAFQQSEPAVAT